MHVLLVEDDATLSCNLASALRDRNFVVDCVAAGGDGLAWPNKSVIDLVILDKHLSDMDGLEFIRKWRCNSQAAPILVLSADACWTSKVECLKAGAEDYVVKPVEVGELEARAHVLRRRWSLPIQPVLLETGNLKLDPGRYIADVQGMKVQLSILEYRLLELLVKRRGVIVSKSELLDALYSLGDEPQENAIEAHVSRLRRKIGPSRIISQRGMGYAIAS